MGAGHVGLARRRRSTVRLTGIKQIRQRLNTLISVPMPDSYPIPGADWLALIRAGRRAGGPTVISLSLNRLRDLKHMTQPFVLNHNALICATSAQPRQIPGIGSPAARSGAPLVPAVAPHVRASGPSQLQPR
ncbi:hypothetical protein PT2222_110300 [Paraburkholderia tropica]